MKNGESLTQDDINEYRLEIVPAFFLNGQEDAADYCNYVFDTSYQEVSKNINNYQDLYFWKS